ncbi:MAG: cytochrome c1 [Aeromonas sp.]
MNRFVALLCLWLPLQLFAASSSYPLIPAKVDVRDTASLQRGVQLFMNYCAGCHSMQYQRYNRVAKDLAIPEDLMAKHLVFNGVRLGDLMHTAMPAKMTGTWFGVAPPDLTLVARVRGADWLNTYLQAFYVDPTRPFGVNNALFPAVAMPHVLEPLQGTPRAQFAATGGQSGTLPAIVAIKSAGNGEMDEEEYANTVRDLVNFLAYAAEPVQIERQRLGFWVLGFLAIFFICTLLLKKEFWRDVR